MFKVILSGLGSCFVTFLFAQSVNTQNGAESRGLGNIHSVLNSDFSVNTNPAFLIQKEKTNALGFDFVHQFNLQELNASSLFFAHQNTKNGFGVSLSRLGGSAYNATYLNIAYAHQIEHLSLGFRNTISQISIAENGTKFFYNLHLGCRYELSEKFEAGLLIENLTRPQIDGYEKLLPHYFLGLVYKASSTVHFFGEFQKKGSFKHQFTLAAAYNHHDVVKFRLGLTPENLLWTAGLGAVLKDSFTIDFAYQLQEKLGSVYSTSLIFKL